MAEVENIDEDPLGDRRHPLNANYRVVCELPWIGVVTTLDNSGYGSMNPAIPSATLRFLVVRKEGGAFLWIIPSHIVELGGCRIRVA